MTKIEYMDELKAALAGFDEEIREEIISDYEEHFADGEANGKSDDEIAAELGSIDDLVNELKSFASNNDENGTGTTDKTDAFFDSKEIEKNIEEVVKGFAGFLGTMAATITKGGVKFSGEAETVAKDVAKEMTKGFGTVADVVVEKSTAFADIVVGKSTAFAKEVAENYKANDGYTFNFGAKAETAEAAEDSEKVETAEEVEETEAAEKVVEGEKVSEKYACKEECKKVIVETDCGDIVIKKSEDGNFNFDYQNNGTANQQLAYKFDWAQNGDTIKVACKKRPGVTNFFNALPCPEIIITVAVPEGLELVEILTASGDVKVEEVGAESVKINTVSGDIFAAGINNGFTSAVSVSGDVTLVSIDTTATVVKTVSGDITLEGNVGSVNAGTTSGDIEIKTAGSKEVISNTVSGDANITLDGAEGFRATLKTASGDLGLQCKEENCKYIKSGTYTLGDGSVQITASSVSGCVKVNA